MNSGMIYVLITVEGHYDDNNVLATLDADRVIEKIKELHINEDIDLFVVEVWNDTKIKEEYFRTNVETDELVNRVKKFISS